MWDKIVDIKLRNGHLIWCLVGDFNVVRYPCERKGLGSGTTYRVEMDNFNDHWKMPIAWYSSGW